MHAMRKFCFCEGIFISITQCFISIKQCSILDTLFRQGKCKMKAAEDDLKLSNYCKEELVHVAGLEQYLKLSLPAALKQVTNNREVCNKLKANYFQHKGNNKRYMYKYL